jgi:hypothetical protein
MITRADVGSKAQKSNVAGFGRTTDFFKDLRFLDFQSFFCSIVYMYYIY